MNDIQRAPAPDNQHVTFESITALPLGNKVSIVVVTKDRSKDCTELIMSLYNQRIKPLEVILIDLSTTPYWLPSKLLHELNIAIYRSNKESSLGHVRAFGTSVAKGDIIAFIDDDAIASPKWIEELLKKHSEGYNIVGGLIKPLYVSNPPKWWDERIFGHLVSINVEYDDIWGCNMSITKETLEKIGTFSPMLGITHGKQVGGEETELLIRAKEHGMKLGFADKGVVYHKIPPRRLRLLYLMKRAYHVGITISLIQTLHLNKRQRIVTKMRRMGGMLKQILKCLNKLLTLSRKEALLAITIILSDLGYILEIPF